MATEDKRFNPFLRMKKKQQKKEENNGVISAVVKSNSPFDDIRHLNSDGQEYWSARELQTILGYTKWQNFEEAVERAKISARNTGLSEDGVLTRFTDASKMVDQGSGVTREIKDYHLDRYACYLTAMNGDPRKPKIAAAQTYFAVKTRQAEMQQLAVKVQQQSVTPSYGQAILQIGQALISIEQEQQRQASVQQQQKEEISVISDRVTKLEKDNKIEKPLPVVSARCKTIAHLTTELDEYGIMSYHDSKALCYELISTDLDIDIEKGLEDYKDNCRRYYAWYKINRGTPPDTVMRPAEINRLGWISYVSTDQSLYNAVVKILEENLSYG